MDQQKDYTLPLYLLHVPLQSTSAVQPGCLTGLSTWEIPWACPLLLRVGRTRWLIIGLSLHRCLHCKWLHIRWRGVVALQWEVALVGVRMSWLEPQLVELLLQALPLNSPCSTLPLQSALVEGVTLLCGHCVCEGEGEGEHKG